MNALFLTLGTVLGSASLLALAQPPWGLHGLAWFALVPWLTFMRTRNASITRHVVTALALGTVYGLVISHWIPEALAYQGTTEIHAASGWLVTSLYATGLPLALIGAVLGVTRKRSALAQVAIAALTVFALDTARLAWLWGVPWALLGHTQASVPGVAQLAALAGVPAISALVLAVNLAIAQLVTEWQASDESRGTRFRASPTRPTARIAAALAGCALALAGFGVETVQWTRGPEAVDGSTRRILAVSHPVNARERWIPAIQRTHLRILGARTRASLAAIPGSTPDLVVFPENALTQPLVPGEPLTTDLESLAHDLDAAIVLGTAERSGATNGVRSFATWVEPDGTRSRVEKQLGVPVVETTPIGRSTVLGALRFLFGLDSSVRDPDANPAARDFEPDRRERATPLRGTASGFSVAPLLCYEAIYPRLTAERRDADTRAIVHLTSDSWLRDPTVVAAQLEAYSRFRAIETRLPYVRVSDASGATVIDAYGRELDRVGVREAGAVLAEVTTGALPGVPERVALVLLMLTGAAAGFTLMLIFERKPSWLFDLFSSRSRSSHSSTTQPSRRTPASAPATARENAS